MIKKLKSLFMAIFCIAFIFNFSPLSVKAHVINPPNYSDLFSIRNDYSSENVIPKNNFVQGGTLFGNTVPGKEAESKAGKLNEYKTNLDQRRDLVVRLGYVIDNYNDLSNDQKIQRKKALGFINGVSAPPKDNSSVNSNDVLTAISNELYDIYNTADFTVLGGGFYGYWNAQRALRYFMGIYAYKKDAADIPAVIANTNIKDYTNAKINNSDTTVFLSDKEKSDLNTIKDGLDKNGTFDLNNAIIHGEVSGDIYMLDLNSMLNDCPTQMKIYKQNMNRLFEYIENQIAINNITPNQTVTISTKPDNPIITCNLDEVIDDDGITKTTKDIDWNATIGNAYGSIVAKVTRGSDKQYDVDVNYYLQDYYHWGDTVNEDINDYKPKSNSAYQAATEGMLSTLAKTDYVCNSPRGGWYYNANTPYSVKEYKMLGIYKQAYQCGQYYRLTIN